MIQSSNNTTTLLAPVPLEDILLDESLIAKLLNIGIESSGDIWVLAVGELIGPHSEFSHLLNRISKDFSERSNTGGVKPYHIELESFAQLVFSNLDDRFRPTQHHRLQEVSTYRVTLSIQVNKNTTVYWQVVIPEHAIPQFTLDYSNHDKCIKDLCSTIRSNAVVEYASIKNWAQPCVNSWRDIQLLPTIDIITDFLQSTKHRRRDLNIFQERLGLISGSRKTLEEVGQRFKITRERVRQIVDRFMRSLRHPRKRVKLNIFSPYLEKMFRMNGNVMTFGEIRENADFITDYQDFSPLSVLEFIIYMCGRFEALDYDFTTGRGYSNPQNVIWYIKGISPEEIKKVQSIAKVKVNNEPGKYNTDDLIGEVSSTSELPVNTIKAVLRTYPFINEDSLGYLSPSKTGDDIQMSITSMALSALRQIGVPAHYTTITKKINECYPERNLKPNHVHNYLSNPLFRWVHRGTYGLAEWGLPEIRPKESYKYGKKLVKMALDELGRPASVVEIEYQVELIKKEEHGHTLLSQVRVILTNNPHIFVTLGLGKWGLVEWNLPVLPVKSTVELTCQILGEDETAWLTIRQLYREMKSRGWHAPFASVNRSLEREITKPNRKIRKEELHGFGIQLYGLSSREWNEENVLAALLSD